MISDIYTQNNRQIYSPSVEEVILTHHIEQRLLYTIYLDKSTPGVNW